MTDSENKKLEEMHEDIRSIKQCLRGYNGNPGLLKEFEDHKCEDKKSRESFTEFKIRTFVFMAFVAGGGGAIGSAITRYMTG